MRIACVYTVEVYYSLSKPLKVATEIPFGISTILTVLQRAGHDVDLFVVTPATSLKDLLGDYIAESKPGMFCVTAVSTQYWQAKKVASFVKDFDSRVFTILGGHHASLAPAKVVEDDVFDAICIGEGEEAVVQLADQLDKSDAVPHDIENLWISNPQTKSIDKYPTGEFRGSLDSIPYFDRKIWEPWIAEPENYPSLILGRGCPFKCTYCSNHAMAKLSEGSYVRFRSPDHIIGELDYIRRLYPDTERVYLEVETFGANRKASYAIFDALAEYNRALDRPLKFGVNLALTSNFMKNSSRMTETLTKARNANLVTINIGLESGSVRMRKLLKRPKYTNDEVIEFCRVAKTFNINVVFFILLGLPDETIEDYMETVRVARAAQPYQCYVSIFYPYLGTDLATHAIDMDLLRMDDLSPVGERNSPNLDLPGFSANRIRFEYIVFWWRVYRGHWPIIKVLSRVAGAFLQAHPGAYSKWIYLRKNSALVRKLTNSYKYKEDQVPQTVGTRVDVAST